MTSTATQTDTPSTAETRSRTLRGLLLARELDDNRTKRGWSTRALASEMRMSPAMLNRIMTGRRIPTALEIGGLCALLDVPADQRPALYKLAHTAHQTQWIIHHPRDTPILAAIEDKAQKIISVCPSPIPGPLRTKRYSSSLQQTQGPSRPERLADIYFLHPAALHDSTIPPAVMREQLRHLTAQRTTIRLLPDSPPSPGAFRLVHIEHFYPVVWLEHTATTVILEDPRVTPPYTEAVITHTNVALSARYTQDALLHLAAQIP